MNKETKAQRVRILRRQVAIEEQHCASCTKRTSVTNNDACRRCSFGKELMWIGVQLDQTIGHDRAGRQNPTIERVTNEMVNIARAKGISRDTLKHRIYQLGWTAIRAVNEPVQRRGKKGSQ